MTKQLRFWRSPQKWSYHNAEWVLCWLDCITYLSSHLLFSCVFFFQQDFQLLIIPAAKGMQSIWTNTTKPLKNGEYILFKKGNCLNFFMVGKGTSDCKISVEVARQWLHDWGFKVRCITKGVYYDGHDRQDVIEARNELLRTMTFFMKTTHQIRRLPAIFLAFLSLWRGRTQYFGSMMRALSMQMKMSRQCRRMTQCRLSSRKGE